MNRLIPFMLAFLLISSCGDGGGLDDEISGYTRYEYDSEGRKTDTLYYTEGPDGLWFTEDDALRSHDAISYDAFGNITGAAAYDSPGIDGLWFTDDDTTYPNILVVEYDTTNNLHRSIYYNSGKRLATPPMRSCSLIWPGELSWSIRWNGLSKSWQSLSIGRIPMCLMPPVMEKDLAWSKHPEDL